MSRQTSLIQSLLLAFVLTLGGSVVWAVVVGWSLLIGEQATVRGRVHEALYVTLDGKPLILRYSGRSFEQSQYLDMEGNLVERNPQEAFLGGATFAAPRRDNMDLRPITTSPRMAAFNEGGKPAIYWYLVADEDAVFFVGYHSLTKLRVGHLGSGGFREERPARSEMFPLDVDSLTYLGVYGAVSAAYVASEEPHYTPGNPGPNRVPPWRVYLISGRNLFEVDLKERSVRTVLAADGLLSVGLAEEVRFAAADGSPAGQRQNLLVRTADELWVVDPRDARRRSYPLPEDARRTFLTVYQTGEEGLLVIKHSNVGQPTTDIVLFWLDASGQIVRRQQVTLQSGVQVVPGQVFVALAVPSPLGLALGIGILQPLEHLQSGEESTYGGALARSFADWWPAFFATFVLSAALAVATYRRHRQYALPGTAVWTLFVLALGPLGFLAYLFHRAWPARLPCEHCGQVCPRDRGACTECQTPFPLPKRKGIEVFA